MATKFYLQSANGATDVATPVIAVDGTWGATASNFARNWGRASQQNTSMVNQAASVALNSTKVFRQYVSAPLNGAQTVSGTLSAAMQQHSTTFTNTISFMVGVRVVASDLTTVRGTCLTPTKGNPWFYAGVSYTSSYLQTDPLAITSVSAQDGDYVVIEIGCNDDNGADTGTLEFGDNGSFDLPIGSQDADATKNGYVLLNSVTLSFKPIPQTYWFAPATMEDDGHLLLGRINPDLSIVPTERDKGGYNG